MVTRLMIISALFFSLQGISQTKRDSIVYDTIFISELSINGFSLEDDSRSVIKALGRPTYFYKGISEISEEEFSIYKFLGDSVSLLFDSENKLYRIEYFMAKGNVVEICKKRFLIGDDVGKLEEFFPNSFNTYMMMKDKGAVGLFLKGKSDDGFVIGIDFNIVIKNDQIYSVSSVEEF